MREKGRLLGALDHVSFDWTEQIRAQGAEGSEAWLWQVWGKGGEGGDEDLGMCLLVWDFSLFLQLTLSYISLPETSTTPHLPSFKAHRGPVNKTLTFIPPTPKLTEALPLLSMEPLAIEEPQEELKALKELLPPAEEAIKVGSRVGFFKVRVGLSLWDQRRVG